MIDEHEITRKAYEQKAQIIETANEMSREISKGTKDYADNEIENVYLKEHPERQKLIDPIEPTWERQLLVWKEKEYNGKGFADGDPVVWTEKGERVRSKSERILADYFYKHGIAYK